jgi:glycosyltransferase involved in cell wall biosynthesis
MRVLHVIPAVAKRYGGPSTAVIAMCRALDARGLETTIACTDADGPGRLDVPLGVAASYEGVRAVVFPRLSSESFKYSPQLSAWLDAHVGDFDVVHIHAVMSHACVAATRACVRAGVPYVLRTLGTLDDWSIGQKSLKKRLFMTAWGDGMLAAAAAVQATSDEERDTLQQRWGVPNAEVIPIGVDDAVFAAGAAEPATPPTVIAIARLHPVKGLDLLIDGFARATLDPALATWRLAVVGDGDAAYVAGLAARARQSTAADRIDFCGWLDGAEKLARLRSASLQALTSHHENFGIAIAEGLACGVPAVVSRAVQIAAAIDHARAGWITGLDRAEIADVFQEAMSDETERRRRGRSAASLAEHWRWSRIAAQLSDLYGRVAHPWTPRVEAPRVGAHQVGH